MNETKEKGIDYCPFCDGELISVVGIHFQCNECGGKWDINLKEIDDAINKEEVKEE